MDINPIKKMADAPKRYEKYDSKPHGRMLRKSTGYQKELRPPAGMRGRFIPQGLHKTPKYLTRKKTGIRRTTVNKIFQRVGLKNILTNLI